MQAKRFFFEKRNKKLSSIAAGTEFERRIQCHPKRIRVFWFFFAKKNAVLCFVSNGLIYLGRNQKRNKKLSSVWCLTKPQCDRTGDDEQPANEPGAADLLV